MSTAIIITTPDNQAIGACESIIIKEARSEDNKFTSVKLEVPRMRFVRERLGTIFSGEQFQVASQRYPVYISVLEDKIETVHLHNVWIMGISVSYMTDEWIIAEGIELEAEYLTGTRTIKQSNDSTSA